MKLSRRRLLQLVSTSVPSDLLPGSARARAYPSRQIKLILAEAAGSSNDIVARIIAPRLSTALGQNVIVENRPGGGTLVGLHAVVAAPPDGYTLLVSSSSALITSALLNRNDPYDLTRDVTPITGVATTSWVLVMNPNVPVQSVRELVVYAKANPGKLNIGYAQGTGPQLVAGSFKATTGVDLVGVPYTGGSHVVTDLLGGSVQLYFGSAATTLSFIRSGALRALVVTGETRDPLIPAVPTMKEAGLPSLTLASVLGILGPSHVPLDVAEKIYLAVTKVISSASLVAGLAKVGYTPDLKSPQQFASLLKVYREKWAPIALNIEASEK